ncbi:MULTISPECIES: Eco57I restriction-modification methylase domain-containing protein [unclassified Bradyrhizobium]|uniref:Eco57I restriction-modification methylase domain-containing protein n=1 Tax=unclassified Bradyrhizobium TaxID=2631580 RepID=UPI002915C8D9|nr:MULTISPECIES: Eco57I restriction-modification methylase domain-containing protein [unclassified Bradyrhizobium]
MISGNLFTRDYLAEGIDGTATWKQLDQVKYETLKKRLSDLATRFLKNKRPSEAETEKDLIWPVLEALGFENILVQQNLSTKGRKQIPDALLFADHSAKQKAVAEQDHWKRYQFGIAVVEAKRWNRSLDRAERRDSSDEGVPSTQMLQYLSRVDVQTSGRLRLGILTDGRRWRLYYQGALSVAEDFFEVDLAKALELPGFGLDLIDRVDERITTERALRLFMLIFAKDAFLPIEGSRTFHEISREVGKTWEERVAKDLSRIVFARLFPGLVDALAKHDPLRPATLDESYLEQVRQSALVLLYRLLFVVYAEDRDLLPRHHAGYKPYSVTQLRLEIAKGCLGKQIFSDRMATYWPKTAAVFTAISEGNDDLGIPPYNGGLFSKDTAPLLQRVQLSDRVIADLIFGLSHQEVDGEFRYINFRDLSVQQLGSIYERILEFGLKTEEAHIVVDADDTARHESGSYYTPDSLVMLIIEKAVGPLVNERRIAFLERASALASDKRPADKKLAELTGLDPAVRVLELKVCDPAMGSGHFLVSLVDWLADRVLALMAEAELMVDWADGKYHSPLANDIVRVRTDIVRHAEEHRWPIVSEHLEDRHIVRRMILKRCIFGVDKNPMAVELAKVALWLHTFTVGAPLSFLDHHLRCGNSLFGSWIRPAMDRLDEWGGPLLIHEPLKRALGAAAGMQMIERLTDADIAEVHQSKNLFDGIESMTSQLDGLLSIVDVVQWQGSLNKLDRATLQEWMKGKFGDPTAIVNGAVKVKIPNQTVSQESEKQLALERKKREITKKQTFSEFETASRLNEWLPYLRAALDEQFLHWQIAFPGVWRRWEGAELNGGFDAVIGNPPYVRQELLGALKPPLKRAFPASYDGYADLYVYFYEQGLKLLRPGGRLSYVVTNKWMKAGYAESLRGLFSEKAWVEFVADFGHAKKFFPDADVFPSVVVVRKPDTSAAPNSTQVCVIPRDAVPEKGLSEAVARATYTLPRANFTKDNWTLEPPNVVALIEKIKRNGVSLREYANVEPKYGIKTGFNEAFLIDASVRASIIAQEPSAEELIRPYLRGQDIQRWSSPESGLYMIVMKSSNDYPWPWAGATDEDDAERIFKQTYPVLHAHFKRLEEFKDPKTEKLKGLRHREDQGRWWWELRSCEYYDAFEHPKIVYQVIQFHPRYSLDIDGRLGNDKVFFLPTEDRHLLAILNSPLMWWFNWRHLTHLKDEALSPMGYKMETIPIASVLGEASAATPAMIDRIISNQAILSDAHHRMSDWLRHEWELERSSAKHSELLSLDADAFVGAIRAALPKKRKLSSTDISTLKREHATIIEPARRARAAIVASEYQLSDIVNEAYGLTPEDVQLMWESAPIRMPFMPAGFVPSSPDLVAEPPEEVEE